MANNAIKDSVILENAKKIVSVEQEFTAEHHCNLIWRLFRHLGLGSKVLSAEELQKAAMEWKAFYSNGSLGYSSNCAKRLSESGVCAKSQSERAKLEYV